MQGPLLIAVRTPEMTSFCMFFLKKKKNSELNENKKNLGKKIIIKEKKTLRRRSPSLESKQRNHNP